MLGPDLAFVGVATSRHFVGVAIFPSGIESLFSVTATESLAGEAIFPLGFVSLSGLATFSGSGVNDLAAGQPLLSLLKLAPCRSQLVGRLPQWVDVLASHHRIQELHLNSSGSVLF